MLGEIITRLGGRYIAYRDEIGLVHRCKGCRTDAATPLFWTLCNRDAAADAVHGQARGERVTCPDCLRLASQPVRLILQAFAAKPRPAVGGLPYRSDPD